MLASRKGGLRVLVIGTLFAWLAARVGEIANLPILQQVPNPVALVRPDRWWRRRTSPSDAEEHIPINFVRAEPTLERARARWRKTLAWRQREGVDAILTKPNANFYAVKHHYPHALHLPDREGHLTYWEMPGRLNMTGLRQCGVSPVDGYRHYVWHSEYTWQLAAPKEGAQAMVLFDAGGFGWEQLSLELLDLIKRIVDFTNQHYPHRAARIVIVNTPSWYNTLYTMIKPIMSDVCEAKLVFLTAKEVRKGALLKWIAPANLPVEYGGKSKVPLGDSKYERSMRAYVDKINKRHGVKPKPAEC
mmetsp:Transcript_11909/g.35309  ORF Transcript_11909/g.35309 Transcript_11909/m.35309 type:complete len:303 (+) Transcript_11909:121-1029(+)